MWTKEGRIKAGEGAYTENAEEQDGSHPGQDGTCPAQGVGGAVGRNQDSPLGGGEAQWGQRGAGGAGKKQGHVPTVLDRIRAARLDGEGKDEAGSGGGMEAGGLVEANDEVETQDVVQDVVEDAVEDAVEAEVEAEVGAVVEGAKKGKRGKGRRNAGKEGACDDLQRALNSQASLSHAASSTRHHDDGAIYCTTLHCSWHCNARLGLSPPVTGVWMTGVWMAGGRFHRCGWGG